MISLIIYNLYPGLYKNVDEWIKQLDHIIDMGFNSIYLNPLHYPGFSGSLYAVKDYYRYNEKFFNSDKPCEDQLKNFLNICHEKKLIVIMDLVISHTSIDSVLISEHKNWYKLDDSGNIVNPGAWENGVWKKWGDLASFDLENSEDKKNLWEYLYKMAVHYLNLGFDGFRCDAAYQVTNDFWKYFIPKTKEKFKKAIFIAETLGCTPVQIQSVASNGFDYIFNSSKWWNFIDPWCLEQYDITKNISPSISFPESHDTIRLLEDTSLDLKRYLRRLYFEAVFSKGFLITTGFEYGFRKKIDVAKTTYQDWENTGLDFSNKIKNILKTKRCFKPLNEESTLNIVNHDNWVNVFCFTKEYENEKVFICLNKDRVNNQRLVFNLEKLLSADKIKDYSPEDKIKGYLNYIDIYIKPYEIKIFASENHCKE